MRLPRGLEWWRAEPGGVEWLESLPRIVDACVETWSLRLEAAFEPAHVSLVVPAALADGRAVVLKVNFPDEESEHEGAALRHWHGDGAVELVAEDRSLRALVVERCVPGDQLWAGPTTGAASGAASTSSRTSSASTASACAAGASPMRSRGA